MHPKPSRWSLFKKKLQLSTAMHSNGHHRQTLFSVRLFSSSIQLGVWEKNCRVANIVPDILDVSGSCLFIGIFKNNQFSVGTKERSVCGCLVEGVVVFVEGAVVFVEVVAPPPPSFEIRKVIFGSVPRDSSCQMCSCTKRKTLENENASSISARPLALPHLTHTDLRKNPN